MIRSVPELRTRVDELRNGARRTVALVSTSGSLHDGHAELIRHARRRADAVVVSIYVNPLRFRTAAEYETYPRRLDEDLELLDQLGVDAVFVPEGDELLAAAEDAGTTVAELGGEHAHFARAEHLDGVLRVEAALLRAVEPDVAVYGMRDAQRVFLVRRLVARLGLRVSVDAVETVRSLDDLPISTRVGLLDAADRDAAAKLPQALDAALASAEHGVESCLAAAQQVLSGDGRISTEYLAVVDPRTFLPVAPDHCGPGLALAAIEVGGHRFVDNAELELGGERSAAPRPWTSGRHRDDETRRRSLLAALAEASPRRAAAPVA
ncbi:pantoate--beta-alanine ligase [Microbacterium album]|uniref:Pantothenate synthetase n=1 Tax=Microbacterium album TaxID=2053191 RepID=A0A917IEH9_9MICO|nr:pantoate--beta-alanine ligase [Microbacterium album]GGH45101.1 pantothenate synthetase [Microbacterium album]